MVTFIIWWVRYSTERWDSNQTLEMSKTPDYKSWKTEDFELNVNIHVLCKMRESVIALQLTDAEGG